MAKKAKEDPVVVPDPEKQGLDDEAAAPGPEELQEETPKAVTSELSSTRLVDTESLKCREYRHCRIIDGDPSETEKVRGMVEYFKSGGEPQVIIINHSHEILDGVATWYALRQVAGNEKCAVRYYEGYDEDSPLLAGAYLNQKHGDRLKGEELRRVCEEMFRQQEGVAVVEIAKYLRINRATAQQYLQEAQEAFRQKRDDLIIKLKKENPKFSCERISKIVLREYPSAPCSESLVRGILKKAKDEQSAEKMGSDFPEDSGSEGPAPDPKPEKVRKHKPKRIPAPNPPKVDPEPGPERSSAVTPFSYDVKYEGEGANTWILTTGAQSLSDEDRKPLADIWSLLLTYLQQYQEKCDAASQGGQQERRLKVVKK